VRLRALYKAGDVNLADSSKGGSGGSAAGSTPAASASSATCTDYTFNATVDFGSGSAEDGARKVPASLGGGS
jgi:hypothetical protein